MYYAQVLLEDKAPKGLIPFIIEGTFGNKINCLDIDESFIVNEVEFGNHGHLGANGSRGSLTQFVKWNIKITTGHTHSAARQDGVLIAGTSTILRPPYVKGASSWINADVIQHTNGKRQHLIWRENGKCSNVEI